MNLGNLLKIYFVRWVRRRYPPLIRVGWHNVRAGVSTRSSVQAGAGAAMMALGYFNKRRRQRTLLYRGAMPLGQSMRVRVRRGGKVIDDFTVTG